MRLLRLSLWLLLHPLPCRTKPARTRQTVQRIWGQRPLWPNPRNPQPMLSPQRRKQLRRLRLLHPSSLHALWWLCAVMTALAKSAPSWHLPVAVANLAIAAKAVVMDGLRTEVIALAVPTTARGTALVTAASVRTAAPVWVMRLFGLSAMR